MKPTFINGLDLCERFYIEAVRPIMQSRFPNLVYSAALIGPGSEVLGFDTAQSMDHDWGPRLQLFLEQDDLDAHRDELDQVLRRSLPDQIGDFPTRFARHEDGTTLMQAQADGSLEHGLNFISAITYFRSILGFDATGTIGIVDWLSVSEQDLLMVTAGRVFHDDLGVLAPLRARLSYYPHDLWLYLLAAQWRRIAQEEAFMGRCGQVGDELGSLLVAGRQVRDLMRLAFLMERTYAPYVKWFGSAFARLDCSRALTPHFAEILAADGWRKRQDHFAVAYRIVAQMHNGLGITDPLTVEVSQYHQRPFWVLHADRFVNAIRARIEDPEVLALPEHLGSIDQFVDSTDAAAYLDRIKDVYGWKGC